MAPAKRKANAAADATSTTTNKKQKKIVEPTASSSRPSRTSLAIATAPRSTRSSISGKSTPVKPTKKTTKASVNGNATKPATKVKATDSTNDRKRGRPAKATNDKKETAAPGGSSTVLIDVPLREKPVGNAEAEEEAEASGEGPAYWLMKAEPESRIEKGKDVKFSIDDLKEAKEPEGWDGVRNAVARNNMRLMMKGDMAFFYHSNCKEPGIVGTMEIVQEHSVDETAFDPEHPYFDEKSDREKPKWCLVHVKFVQKFLKMIKLKELQKYAKNGGVLENMQGLRQTRLSVSKVSKKEWDFIMGLNDVDDTAAMSAAHQPNMLA